MPYSYIWTDQKLLSFEKQEPCIAQQAKGGGFDGCATIVLASFSYLKRNVPFL